MQFCVLKSVSEPHAKDRLDEETNHVDIVLDLPKEVGDALRLFAIGIFREPAFIHALFLRE